MASAQARLAFISPDDKLEHERKKKKNLDRELGEREDEEKKIPKSSKLRHLFPIVFSVLEWKVSRRKEKEDKSGGKERKSSEGIRIASVPKGWKSNVVQMSELLNLVHLVFFFFFFPCLIFLFLSPSFHWPQSSTLPLLSFIFLFIIPLNLLYLDKDYQRGEREEDRNEGRVVWVLVLSTKIKEREREREREKE